MWHRALVSRARFDARLARFLLVVAAIPTAVAAQDALDADSPRARLRERYRTPQTSQRLDEHVRKLKGTDPTERLEGIRGLGEIDDPRAVDYLIAAANDPDPRVRVKAIDILGNVRAKEAIPLLTQQLFLRDIDAATKRRILACLGKIGDPRATRPIVDFLSRDVDTATLGSAIFALGDIGDRSAVAPLRTLAETSEDTVVRGLAHDALRKIQARPEPAFVPPALAVERREGTASGRP
jgi:HEAT repeat protein